MEAGDPAGERFVRGAFRRSIDHLTRSKRGLQLFRFHDHKDPVGTAVSLTDDADGPVAEFRLAVDDPEGARALGQVKAGLLPDVSVGFRAIRERRGTDGAREILEASLHEVSLVAIGAYAGARVLAVRDAEKVDLEWVRLPTAPPVDVDLPIRVR